MTVVIQGDGPLTYQLRPIDPHRLSLDLLNAVSGFRFRALPVDHHLLKRIRIGQHSKTLRMVFDLNHPLTKGLRYAIKAQGKQVSLRLSFSPHP